MWIVFLFEVDLRASSFLLLWILTAFNKLKIMSEFAHKDWKSSKHFYRFHTLVFHRGYVQQPWMFQPSDSRLGAVVAWSNQILYERKTILVFFLHHARSDNERWGLYMLWLSQRWRPSFSVIAIFSWSLLRFTSTYVIRTLSLLKLSVDSC
jgi:hypothetical protein